MPETPEYSHPGELPRDYIRFSYGTPNVHDTSDPDLDRTEYAPVKPNLNILVREEEAISEQEYKQEEGPAEAEPSQSEVSAYRSAIKNIVQQCDGNMQYNAKMNHPQEAMQHEAQDDLSSNPSSLDDSRRKEVNRTENQLATRALVLQTGKAPAHIRASSLTVQRAPL